MNPTSHRRSVFVGLFVIVAIAILAGGVLTVGNLNDSFTRRLTVSAVFEQVGGLKQGDNIWFSGLKVGIVKELDFHGASQVKVEMNIDRKAAEHIRHDVTATVGADGLIGNRIVVLAGGTPGVRDLADGDVLAIGESVSTEALMATLAANNTNLLAITADVKGITARIANGEGTVGKLLVDDELYTSVTGAVDTLGLAADSARSATASLSSFAGDLNRSGNLAKSLVNDTTTYPSLTATVDDLEHAGQRASDMIDSLAKSAADPNTPLGTLTSDEAAGADLKATLANLNQGSVLLNEDLEAAQHNILLRRYFRKKARAEAKAENEE